MERELMDACQAGNVNLLHQLLRSNPFLLHSTALYYPAQNPLHTAAIAGHVDFTREILKLKPEFAGEVNQDGFTALHLAAANAQLEIVRELVKVNKDLCRVEGRDGKTPLHCAALKGRVEVIGEMLASCPGCVDDVTVRRETALYLAVRNSQFGAVKVLTDWMAVKNKREALNFKDEQGNTVLHLAAWKKQRLVIELLLGNRIVDSGTLEVNAINHAGLTALDFMLMFPSEAGDREIIDILQAAGAQRASAREFPPSSQQQSADDHTTPPPEPRCRTAEAKELLNYFKFKKGRDSPSEARSALLVIAVLVATATFQLGINPPGGVWQDTYAAAAAGKNTTADYTKPHNAGESILASANAVAYSMVAVFNTIGFSTALLMINVLTKRFPLQLELQICMTAMYVAYNTSIISIAPDADGVRTIVILSISIFPILMGFAVHWARTAMYHIEQLVQRMTRRLS